MSLLLFVRCLLSRPPCFTTQLLNDLELAGQPILVKVGKKEQPSLEAFLDPKDEDYAKKHQILLDAVKEKVSLLVEPACLNDL